MKINKDGYIYLIKSPSNKIYIGQTKNLNNRIKNYSQLRCKAQTKIYNSLLKYGWDNHIFEVIEVVELDKLNEREIYWISFYDSFNNGLNCTIGGDGNKSPSIETKDKISKSLTGYKHTEQTKKKMKESAMGGNITSFKKGIQSPMKGKKHTEESKQKNREKHLGIKPPDRSKKIMLFGIIYKSYKEACEKYNMKKTTFRRKYKNYIIEL